MKGFTPKLLVKGGYISYPYIYYHQYNLCLLNSGNPLACSCNLLWLHTWLQETSSMGPRCVDGIPLREIRISRQQCTSEDLTAEPVAPGCEAELLSAPGIFGTSQIFTPFMNLKTADNSTNGKKSPNKNSGMYRVLF